MKRLVILLPVLLAFQVGAPPALAWTWPVDGPVLRPFTFGDDPYAGGQHRGIDIGAAAAAAVRAPAAGTVSFAGTVPGGGRVVTVRTPDGYSVTLVHLGTIAVSGGAAVAEGDAVGTVGPSGEAELAEPYVHLGIRETADPNGYLDPLTFLPPRGTTATEPDPATATDPSPADEGSAPAPAVQPDDPAAAPEGAHAPAAGAAARGHAGRAHLRLRHGFRARRTGTHEGRARPAERRGRAAPSESFGAAPTASRPARESLRSFEPTAATGPLGRASQPPRDGGPSWTWALLPGALGAALLALRLRRQVRDARPADGATAVLLEPGDPAAEDASGLGLRQEDDLVLDGDLERILLAEPKPLADLDRDHDPSELVDVSDDPCRRSARRARCGSHHLSRVHALHAWHPSVRTH